MRNDSFKTPEFIALARKYKVAVVLAGDSDYPQIADITAPFVYARIMGTTDKQAKGYATKAIDAWADRARQLAAGTTPGRPGNLRGTARKSSRARCLPLRDQRLQGTQSGRCNGVDRAALTGAVPAAACECHNPGSETHATTPTFKAARPTSHRKSGRIP